MQFDIDRNVLMRGVSRTLGITEKKTTLPILNNILLKTEEDRLKIVATDREISLITRLGIEIVEPGEITISAKKVFEMAKEVQEEKIRVVTNERNRVTMTAGKVVYRLNGMPAEDFPSVIEWEDMPLYEIAADGLATIIRKSIYASPVTDDAKNQLRGVYFEVEDSVNGPRLKMTATDGHRLAMAYGQPGEAGDFKLENGVIIPRKGLTEVRRILEEVEGTVRFGVDDGVFVLKTQDTTLKVSLIDGVYPDYRRVLPAEKGVVVRLDRQSLLHALKRMNVISSSSTSGAAIFTFQEGRIVVNSNDPDLGEAIDEIDANYEGQEMVLAYNVNYLIQALEVMDAEEILLDVRQGMKPAVLRGVGNDDYISIIMPLKLEGWGGK